METPERPMEPPEFPDPIQVLEDQSPAISGSRKPGNLWTFEAREDMFNRREAGEGWETICLDYPKRSRHAMQQQYSMMKKQKALANGTWNPRRRGRKRKAPVGEKWPPVDKVQSAWGEEDDEDETEDEDYEGPEIEESELVREGSGQESHLAMNEDYDFDDPNRPRMPARSATDPSSRPQRSKIIKFDIPPSFKPDIPPSLKPSRQKMGPVSSPRMLFDPDAMLGSEDAAYPNKRRKSSPEHTDKPESLTPVAPATYFSLPSVMFDEEEWSSYTERARQKARDVMMGHEAEKSSLRQNFEKAVSRANRRTYEAQEKLRAVNHEHADTIKLKEEEHSFEIGELKICHAKAEKQREQVHSDTIEQIKAAYEIRIKEQQNSYEGALKAIEAAREAATSSKDTDDIKKSLAETQQSLATKAEEIERLKGANSVISGQLDLLHALQRTAHEPIRSTQEKYKQLSASVHKLSDELEDMSMKAITKSVHSIVQEQDELGIELEQAVLQSAKASKPNWNTTKDEHSNLPMPDTNGTAQDALANDINGHIP